LYCKKFYKESILLWWVVLVSIPTPQDCEWHVLLNFEWNGVDFYNVGKEKGYFILYFEQVRVEARLAPEKENRKAIKSSRWPWWVVAIKVKGTRWWTGE
jgi:hypothetical protein